MLACRPDPLPVDSELAPQDASHSRCTDPEELVRSEVSITAMAGCCLVGQELGDADNVAHFEAILNEVSKSLISSREMLAVHMITC